MRAWTGAALLSIWTIALTAWTLLVPADASHSTPDGLAYRFQANTLATGRLAAPAPPVPDAFRLPLVDVREDRWVGQYYLGFPVLLAAGTALDLDWIVNPLLAGFLVFATFGVARLLGHPRAGLIAATLLATSPLLFNLTTTYLSHVATGALLIGGTWALLRGQQTGQTRWGWLAGFLLGWAFACRPFTTLLLGAVVGLAALIRAVRVPGDRRLLLVTVVAALPWLASIGVWNYVHSGDVSVSAYELNRPDVGIGFREIPPHARFEPGREITYFGPAVALEATRRQLVRLGETGFGAGPWIWGLILAALITGYRHRWLRTAVGSAAMLVGGYFFYSGAMGISATTFGPRYYGEALPALALLIAYPLSRLWDVSPRIGRTLILALLAFGAWDFARHDAPERIAALEASREHVRRGPNRDLARHLAATRTDEPRLTFVDARTLNLRASLLANEPDLSGPDVLAAHRGPDGNDEVIAAFPDHVPHLATWSRETGVVVAPYDPATAPPVRLPRRSGRRP